jgi:hypothetical protein
LVVLPNNKDSYFWVKQSAELTVGCLTQCVKCDTLFKLSETTVRNILLKINTKSNGLNHVVHDLKLVTDEPCMVMGADVTHPSPQATAIPSVVAVTASEDLTATKYNISVDLQVPRQTMSEMIQNLESITVDKLRTFIARNNTPPARIYFFRDGVSEGEFDRVRDVEIKADPEGVRYRLQEPPSQAHVPGGAEAPPHQILPDGEGKYRREVREVPQRTRGYLRGPRHHRPDPPEFLSAVAQQLQRSGEAHKVLDSLRREQAHQR